MGIFDERRAVTPEEDDRSDARRHRYRDLVSKLRL
jgi:hypothetical protein